ncbi:hypothetical protein AAZV13_18G242200 [Glycine max]
MILCVYFKIIIAIVNRLVSLDQHTPSTSPPTTVYCYLVKTRMTIPINVVENMP